jgi:hypothetical protein
MIMDDQQEYPNISETLMRGIRNYLEGVSAKRLSRGLRSLLMAYLRSEMDIGCADFFEDFIVDLDFLFDFLDLIEDECRQTELNTTHE